MASANPADEDYDPSLVNTEEVPINAIWNGPKQPPGPSNPGYIWAHGPRDTWIQVAFGNPNASTSTPSMPPPPAATDKKPPPADTGTKPPPSTGPQVVGPTLPDDSIGSLLKKFDEKPPAYVNPSDAAAGLPAGPAFPTLPKWQAPTGDEAANAPGYKFAYDQSIKAAENSAAARGVTNTGGTIQDIINYGRNAATQNYQNVYNNAMTDYTTNATSQYLAPYQAAFNTWSQTLPASQTAASNLNMFNWNSYLKDYDIYRNQKLDTSDMLNSVANRGATVQ